jgi:YbbR domain-containing protein
MTPSVEPAVKVLTHNWRIKLLAVVMAAVTWYMIREAISFEVMLPGLRLEVRAPAGMAILNQSATTVDVTFRGSQEDIRLLDPRQIQIVVERPPRSDARLLEEIALTPEAVRGAQGVRAVKFDPRRVRVTLDREEEKRVPVQGRTTGQPLFGEVESVACEPPTVRLRGPAAKLKVTEAVYAQPVDVDGRIETFVRRSPVQPPGDNWMARLDPAEVQVRVVIAARPSTVQTDGVAVTAVVDPGQSAPVTIEPPAVTVRLTGRSNELAALSWREVRVFADCSGLEGAATYTVPLRVYLPARSAVVARTEPETVRVTCRLNP